MVDEESATTKKVHLESVLRGDPGDRTPGKTHATGAPAAEPAKKIAATTDAWIQHVLQNKNWQLELLENFLFHGNDGGGGGGGDSREKEVALRFLMENVRDKRSGYKQQDLQKNKYDAMRFVSREDILQLLWSARLQCHYCRGWVHLLYENVREPQQWTLDRIDNDQGHNRGNLYIACLSCNLRRRCLNSERYRFTKQLRIVKRGSGEGSVVSTEDNSLISSFGARPPIIVKKKET